MNTKLFEQYDVMDTEMLAHVEGGGRVGVGEFTQALGICTVAGGIAGSVVPITGTLGGAVLGAQFCTGIWGLIRTH